MDAKIYWANALFSQADREFNQYCVSLLREAGYQVFLPQELSVNQETSPTAQSIFQNDTIAILKASLLIACLDQETIDCGVACEIGIAYTYNIPVIGLCTDIRQRRSGLGRVYKNPYVIGAIEAHGEVVTSINDLLLALPKYLSVPTDLSDKSQREFIKQHYTDVSANYLKFINLLESWYQPQWSAITLVGETIKSHAPLRVFELGCGTGEIGHSISVSNRSLFYLGFDLSSEMVSIASSSHHSESCIFTSDLEEIRRHTQEAPFDLALLLFSLHDQSDKLETLEFVSRLLHNDGKIFIIDLSTQDLPYLVRKLKQELGRPLGISDTRIEPAWLVRAAKHIDMDIVSCCLQLLTVSFPTSADLDEYLKVFGIYSGMDLPLGFLPGEFLDWRTRVQEIIEDWKFPFTDQRVFIACIMMKQPVVRAVN
jgi:nucleoside 2-deoxyribosyltransferase/ubiquinone/menaquinone biosynthesis C-methylase UbiE